MDSIISMYLFSFATAITTVLLISPATGGRVGLNYGDHLPISPSRFVRLLKSHNISYAQIYDTNSSVLSAFSGSGISLTVSLPNDLLPSAANSSSFTDSWLQSILPSTTISSIAVGNEAISNPNLTSFLLPAMENLYSSLHSRNLNTKIKISSALPLSALNLTYPPSAGAFKTSPVPSVFPMLSFLRRTSSFLMVNVHPLDAQNDAVYSAMAALHFSSIPVVITVTGWPSKGDADYNRNLFRRLLNGGGTPQRPNQPLVVFVSQTPTPSAASYNDTEVAIVPPTPAAAIRVRDESSFGGEGKGKADKLPRVTVPEGATGRHPPTMKIKN